MKRRILISLLVPFFLMLFAAAAVADYPASTKSSRYHYPDCKLVKHIKPRHLIKFKTPADAVKAGYNPCKLCRPPVK
jgi:micrococcal nuclease